ncbi:hypothetical protein [Paracoccus aminovorans]|nr:hypothetical protein [Paracoccus aminovorans]
MPQLVEWRIEGGAEKLESRSLKEFSWLPWRRRAKDAKRCCG